MVESIGRHPLLGPLRQVEAGLLSVGYAQAGPGEGRVAVLLHGWPYDPHRYLQVAPLLAAAGDRVLVPSLRGLWDHPLPVRCPVPQRPAGRARGRPHRAAGRPGDRAGGPGRLRLGARTAAICAALWPQRCAGLVSVSGYLIGSQQAGRRPLPPEAERRWWSQDYFATERGRVGYGTYRREFAELIWRTASPRWAFDQASFDRTAQSFDNPDHVEVVIHNYRWRLGLADGEADYQELEERLAEGPVIGVATITLEGDANGAPHPDPSSYAGKFTGPYAHRTIAGGIGHNLPQEAPEAFAKAVIEVDPS